MKKLKLPYYTLVSSNFLFWEIRKPVLNPTILPTLQFQITMCTKSMNVDQNTAFLMAQKISKKVKAHLIMAEMKPRF